jgi:hypothetical protein
VASQISPTIELEYITDANLLEARSASVAKRSVCEIYVLILDRSLRSLFIRVLETLPSEYSFSNR